MKEMKITDIPNDIPFEGYYWLSDQHDPRVLQGEPLPQEFYGHNPFVIEAQLWDSKGNVSWSLHQAGNQVIVNKYEVKDQDFNNKNVKRVNYASHRMGVEHVGLSFLEYWEVPESQDTSACCGMPTLQFTKRVFIGFEPKKEQK